MFVQRLLVARGGTGFGQIVSERIGQGDVSEYQWLPPLLKYGVAPILIYARVRDK